MALLIVSVDTVSNDATVGIHDWSTTASAYQSSNNTRGSVNLEPTADSKYLKCTFVNATITANIASGDTINSVNFVGEARAASTDVVDSVAKVVIAGTISGSDISPGGGGTAWATSDTDRTYAASLSGLTITADDVRHANFGFALSVINNDFMTTRLAEIDYLRVEIDYTAAGGGGTAVPVFMTHMQQQGMA